MMKRNQTKNKVIGILLKLTNLLKKLLIRIFEITLLEPLHFILYRIIHTSKIAMFLNLSHPPHELPNPRMEGRSTTGQWWSGSQELARVHSSI